MKSRKKVLKIALNLEKRYAYDMLGFVRNAFDFTGLPHDGPTDQQALMCQEFVKHRRVCISGGGGLGKTATAAWGVIWALLCHVNAKVLVTGPTGNQLADVLWSEIELWLKRCRFSKLLDKKSRIITVKGFPEWKAVMRTRRQDDKRDIDDTMAGLHGRWMFAFVDEGSSVDDPTYTAIEGAMTGSRSFIYIISNPVSESGYYYDTLTAEPDENGLRNGYRVLNFDSRESPLVTEQYVQNIVRRYGKDSKMYRTKVLGLPLKKSSLGVVVSPADFDRIVQTQRDYTDGPVVISVDPAGPGGDKTVICVIQGVSVIMWKEQATSDVYEIEDEIVRIWASRFKGVHTVCVVDAIGSDLYTVLTRRRYFPVIPHIGSERAQKEQVYANRRSEVMHILKERFEYLHFPIAPPSRLKKELANIKFVDDDPKGRIMVEPKRKFRKRLKFSPDYTDALAMGVAADVHAGMQANLVSEDVAARLSVPATSWQGMAVVPTTMPPSSSASRFL